MSRPPLHKPRAVQFGDRLGIVAPASPFDIGAFERGVHELRSLGFEVVFDDRVFARTGYVAGAPRLRAEALHALWADPSVAGLICARGGYGSVQLLPHLNLPALAANPKVFVGYSDVTALLTVLVDAGVVVFHGPTVVGRLSEGASGYDRESLLRAIMSRDPLGEIDGPDLDVVVRGEASGPLFGGTLTQLAASLGTPFAFDPPAGHILFLDEVGERPYRLDRLLTQLRFAGILARASAVVFGELPRCDEPGGRPTARDVVEALFEGFHGPVLMGLSSGHTSHPARTLPLGVLARVVTEPAPKLIVDEAAVQ